MRCFSGTLILLYFLGQLLDHQEYQTAQGRDTLASLNWWVFPFFQWSKISCTELLRLDPSVAEGGEGGVSCLLVQNYCGRYYRYNWFLFFFFFFWPLLYSLGLLVVCFRLLLSDKVFKQRFRKFLLLLNGLIGKERVKIRPFRSTNE